MDTLRNAILDFSLLEHEKDETVTHDDQGDMTLVNPASP